MALDAQEELDTAVADTAMPAGLAKREPAGGVAKNHRTAHVARTTEWRRTVLSLMMRHDASSSCIFNFDSESSCL